MYPCKSCKKEYKNRQYLYRHTLYHLSVSPFQIILFGTFQGLFELFYWYPHFLPIIGYLLERQLGISVSVSV